MNYMHVVYVCAEYPYIDRATGGFGTYVKNISAALLKLGYQITIVCMGSRYEIIHRHALQIIVLPGNRVVQPLGFINRILSFFAYPLGFSWQVSRVLPSLEKQTHIDIIEGGDFGAELFFYLFCKSKTGPITVIKLHTPSFVIRKYNSESLTLFYRFLEQLEKYCLVHVFKLYSPTRALSRLVSTQIHRSIEQIIPYAISKPAKIRIKKRDKVILYVGKFQPKKGVYDLINAIPAVLDRFDDVHFFFVGPDTQYQGSSVKKSMQQLIHTLNVKEKVTLVDSVSTRQLRNYYQKAQLCIVPSHWENFPNVILEAGLYGCAIIAARVGGIPEIIQNNRTGILIPPCKPNLLARRICDLLGNTSKRQMFALNLRKHLMLVYSAEKIGLTTERFYLHLVKERELGESGRYTVQAKE